MISQRYIAISAGLCVIAMSLAATSAFAIGSLHLHPPDSQQLDFAALSSIIEEETGIQLVADPTNTEGDDPLESLFDGSADLAIVENSRSFVEGVRTVLPLYQGVVHLAAANGFSPDLLRAEQRPPRIQILDGSHAGKLVVDLLFERATSLNRSYDLWEPGNAAPPDLIAYVGPVNPSNTEWFPEGFSLVSVSHYDNSGAEFYLEGISYLVPQLQPTRIPARTYKLPGNEEGINALAVDMLLVAHRDADADEIYALTRVLIEQKPRFAAAEPALFRWLNSSFDDVNFAFPLHSGARRYFERDNPGFLERYAETMNFLAYLIAMLITGVVAIGRWRARRRKDRIDGFYLRVLELRKSATLGNPVEALSELETLERAAFDGLVNERLAADDSFRIFTELAGNLRLELQAQIDAT